MTTKRIWFGEGQGIIAWRYAGDPERNYDARVMAELAAAGNDQIYLNWRRNEGLDPLLLAGDGGETLLMAGAYGGSSLIVGDLLAAGLSPHAVAADGSTPLHFAAERLNLGAAEMLIAFGADVRAANGHGRSALHGALAETVGRERSDHDRKVAAVARLLLSAGADPDETSERAQQAGMSLLDLACSRLYVATALVLIEAGARPGGRTGSGRSTLGHFEYALGGYDSRRFDEEEVERLGRLLGRGRPARAAA